MAPQQSEDQRQQQTNPAWWWRSANGRQSAVRAVTNNETELLSAAVLCAALSSTKASPSGSDALFNARAARELEMHVRKSPLPHTLQLPVLEFTTDYVLVEAEGAFICAMRATSPSDIVQAVVGSAVPFSQPYMHRFGGSRVHAPFWKRVRRLNLAKLYEQAQRMDKILLLCGHSIGGSIAKLAFCELVYSSLPGGMREVLAKLDADQPKANDKGKEKHFRKHKKQKNELADWIKTVGNNDREAALQNLPVAMAVGFGAPYAERLVTIAKATKALLNLLPAPMQQRIADMAKDSRLSICSMRELYYHVEGEPEFNIFADPLQIRKALGEEGDEATTGLTGNSILQHMMTAYVDAIARRSRSIQINATMNHYERLGVARNASDREIRRSYRSLALRWHPDRIAHGSLTDQQKEVAEDIFKLLAESYEVLSNKESRCAYDAYLNRPPSRREEFMQYGTVDGITLDEAISTFKDAVDNISSQFHPTVPVSTSTVQQVSSTARNAEISTQSIDTRSSSDSISSSSKSTSTSLKTVSVVGGAVAVAASVAIIVSAWSQFSEASRKKLQAAAVRDMSGDCLVLLMEDRKSVHQRQSRTPSIQLLQESKARQIKAFAIASTPTNNEKRNSGDSSLYLAKEAQNAIVELTQKDQDQDDKLIEEFFECATKDEDAAVEAMAEEEFFDCVWIVQDVDQHFTKKHEKLRHLHGKKKISVMFPRGSKVNTPFGLGVVEDWRENTAVAAIRFEDESLRYIDKTEITRGASMARELTNIVAKERRAELAERVIVTYGLEETKTGDHITNVALAGAGGAVDSGLRAAGGLALANGMTRSGTALGGMVAAPLAVASILVDIGKEFYDYRKKHTERKELGVLSSTSERLMRRDFRLKTGEVVVSRTTAAAGAGLGAYGVASAMTMWAAAGVATGPIGIVAATSAAVVGGVVGYFGGAKVYSLSTASYFKSQKHAKEHIDRLELGARVLFEEHDPEGTGEISKEACLSIMQKLYEISGDTSDFAYEASVEAIKDPSFEGQVTWRMFWIWVSTEAARSLKSLEHQDSQPIHNSDGERKRDKLMRKFREAKQKHHEKHHPDENEGAVSSPKEVDFEEVERDIHARAAFAPVLPGEEDNSMK
ncbi:Alpha/Beta hydrolase fold [Phytophthora cactorum]|nr:Alpha/Beta hydrolase fold [Phytophthora cactorum]